MPAHDAQYADHPMCPYHEPQDVDPEVTNERQERIEAVADRHWDSVSPELIEWIADDPDCRTYAALLVSASSSDPEQRDNAARMARHIREDWTQFVAVAGDCYHWPMARRIAQEVGR